MTDDILVCVCVEVLWALADNPNTILKLGRLSFLAAAIGTDAAARAFIAAACSSRED